jgi:hypothetical protein
LRGHAGLVQVRQTGAEQANGDAVELQDGAGSAIDDRQHDETDVILVVTPIIVFFKMIIDIVILARRGTLRFLLRSMGRGCAGFTLIRGRGQVKQNLNNPYPPIVH